MRRPSWPLPRCVQRHNTTVTRRVQEALLLNCETCPHGEPTFFWPMPFHTSSGTSCIPEHFTTSGTNRKGEALTLLGSQYRVPLLSSHQPGPALRPPPSSQFALRRAPIHEARGRQATFQRREGTRQLSKLPYAGTSDRVMLQTPTRSAQKRPSSWLAAPSPRESRALGGV